MTDLPRHPLSGLEAIAVLPSGRIVWPISGGDGKDDDPAAGKDAGKTGAEDGAEDDDAADTDADKGKDKDPAAEAAKWKALARKHEGQAKANAKAAEELRSIKDKDKTELERATEKAADAERRAAESEARFLRAEVAAEKGLTLAMAKRLVGTTRDEIEADADELIAELGKSTPAGDAGGSGADDKSGRPREKLRPGAVPGAEAEETDPTKLAAKVPRI